MAACSNILFGMRQNTVHLAVSVVQRQEIRRGFHQLHTVKWHPHVLTSQKMLTYQNQTRKAGISFCGLVSVRLNSSGAATNDTSQIYIPEPPPETAPLEAIDSLNALGEASLSSVGLGGWFPPGMVQQCLEMIHVNCGMPWWSSIVICTIALRVLMFPLVIKSQQNVAKLHNHMPQMTKLQQRFTDARASGDPIQASKAGYDLMTFMQTNNIKPARNFLVPLAQMPVFLSMFFGLRQMSTLPLESLKDGGMLWFVDLTVADPTYGLPLLTVITLAATTEIGVDGVKAQSMGHIIKWVFRGLPVVIFPIISNFPCAMLCYWFTSNAFSLIQVAILKVPAIRTYFSIEKMVHHQKSVQPKKKFLEGFKESWNNAKMTQLVEERQRVDAAKFKEAGQGPIQKTFAYNPTKSKKQTAISTKSGL